MKKKNVFFVLCFCIIVLSSNLLCGAQENHKFQYSEYDEPIYGAWIGDKAFYGKMIFYPDGTADCFDNASDRQLFSQWKYKIAERWTDSEGATWYKIEFLGNYEYEGQQAVGFEIWIVDESGDIMKCFKSMSQGEYPTDFEPYNAHIYYREK